MMLRVWLRLINGLVLVCCALCLLSMAAGQVLPGSAQVAYSRASYGRGQFTLMLYDANRSLHLTLLTGFEEPLLYLGWSATGDALYFDQYAGGRHAMQLSIPELRLTPVDASAANRPAQPDSAFSPDGRWRAFIFQFARDQPHLYLQIQDGTGAFSLGAAGVYEVAWRP